jgi:3-oxoadipate enol-lactonase
MSARLGSICDPTLVICGSEDRLMPLRNSQFLAGGIPGARLQVIPEAGHFVMLEKPLEVAQAVAEFVSTIPYHPGDPASS